MTTRPAFFFKLDGKELGPFSRAEVRRRLARGELKADDLARTDQAPAFLPVATLLDPATERQTDLLRSLSVDIPPNLSKAAASKLISATYARQWQSDPITEGQMTRLRRYGIRFTADTTKGEASELIDAWLKAHPQAESQYQRRKAARAGFAQLVVAAFTVVGGFLGAMAGAAVGSGWLLVGLLVGAALGFQKGKTVARRFGRFN